MLAYRHTERVRQKDSVSVGCNPSASRRDVFLIEAEEEVYLSHFLVDAASILQACACRPRRASARCLRPRQRRSCEQRPGSDCWNL